MTISSFLKDWNKTEECLVDFMCDYLVNENIQFFEIDRNCSYFIIDNNLDKITEFDIKLLINRILKSE